MTGSKKCETADYSNARPATIKELHEFLDTWARDQEREIIWCYGCRFFDGGCTYDNERYPPESAGCCLDCGYHDWWENFLSGRRCPTCGSKSTIDYDVVVF